MRRREFIAVLSGVAAAWPLEGRAQQPAVPTIGFLSSRSASDSASILSAFRRGLYDIGYVEGQNLGIEYRWADGQYDRLPSLATSLVERGVVVIAAVGDAVSALAAKKATAAIPIAFVIGGDPIQFGLVASINRPGGNITGVSLVSGGLGAKRLSLLHELVPNAAVLALLVNPDNPNAEPERKDVERAGRTLGKPIAIANATAEHDLDTAFATFAQQRVGGLLVATDPFLLSRRDQIVELAARAAIPTMYQFREFAAAGGLMSYGTNLVGAYRLVGSYTARMLKGEKPADIPVFQQTQLELVINLRTAKSLGLSIPPTLLVFADEVIE